MQTKKEPRIVNINPKSLIGKRQIMSLTDNRTSELWRDFMSRRGEIHNRTTHEYISLQVYGPTYFANFNPANRFEKWAAVEVTDFGHVPADMEQFTLSGGLYAVFDYKGSSDDPSIFRYIFEEWLPASGYQLDNRPHFEILGEKYKNGDPNSEEEIWIPVRLKNIMNLL